ncbi:hypothetical protein [Nonomuraea sp. SBT364]|uniref:hypothetical protein n=1 Tax=Nonomuraea sp. SBT364 TaxID=1580530 RepID=UPI00066C02FA|nr:hypothetical protein [Nonomuraea sp. SBT364]
MRLLRPARQTTYERVFGTVYVALMTNVLLALSCAPLLVTLALVRDPLASWPFFAVLSLLCAPALAGAFRCFAALGEGSTAVLPAFWSGYRQAGRALAVWAAAGTAVTVLIVDAAVVAGTSWGPALVPFFVTAALFVIALGMALLVLVAEPDPEPRPLRALIRPVLWLVARRWYLALLNVAVLGLAVNVILAKPVPGLLLACAPLLYVVWSTTRYVVEPLTFAGR